MFTSFLAGNLETRTNWVDHEASLFNKKKLVFKSKETNPIFGEFDLMELKNNPEVSSLKIYSISSLPIRLNKLFFLIFLIIIIK
jgi:hypothetical protein